MLYLIGLIPSVDICRVVVACPWSVVSSRYCGFFLHVKPQNSNIRAFKNAFISHVLAFCVIEAK